VSDVQPHCDSADTLALVEKSFARRSAEMSTPAQPVEPYFSLLDFKGIENPEQRRFLNQIATSFSLTDEQVHGLITAGGELLLNHPEFQRLMADLATRARSGP
jgi:hypothetical protein